MTKKIKSIIITLSVGLIALVAYFVADYIISNQEEDTTTTVQLTNLTASDIASVKITLQNGEYYYITENAEVSDTVSLSYKVTFNGLYEGLEYNATSAGAMMSYVCLLTAQRDLGVADESEYGLYGLDDPLSVATVTKLDGDTFNIYVGSQTNANASYYCRIDGSDHVYIISGTHGDMFTREPNDMRISQINMPFDTSNISTITWKYGDNEPVYIYRDLEGSVYNPFTKYYVSSPWGTKMPINGDMFAEMVGTFKVLFINDYITPKLDGTDIDLADYGLDDPWGYYKIVGTDGTVQEFSFGDYTEGVTQYYCYMLDHSSNHIYTISRDRVAFIEDYTALDVTSVYIINAFMADIQSLRFEINGAVSTLECVRTYLSDAEKKELEDAGEDVVDYNSKFTLDGVSYDSYSLSMLYRCVTGMLNQNVYKDYKHDEEAMLKLTFDPFDADEPIYVLEFYKIDSNYCAAYINGKCDFIVSMRAVNSVIEAVDIVKEGGTPSYVL